VAAWLDLAALKARSIMPGADVDALEASEPGFAVKRLTIRQAWIGARLAKRYDLSFPAGDIPEIVLGWLTALVTLDLYLKRGWNPSSEQDALIAKDAETAATEIKEAADSATGLFDLPLRESAPGTSGVVRGGPFAYSEASPYAWTDGQVDDALSEDR